MSHIPQESGIEDFDKLGQELGLIDDQKSQAETSASQIQKMQEQLNTITAHLQGASKPGDYANVRSDRDVMVDRYAKLVNEFTKMGGQYDPATGEVSISQKKEEGPDHQAMLADLDKKLNKTREDLNKKLNDGTLTTEEYLQQLDDQTQSIRDKKLDLMTELKTQSIFEKREQAQATKQQAISQQEAIKNNFAKIIQQYPESNRAGTDLHNAMLEILNEDKTIDISKVNYGEMDSNGNITKYTGDPQQRLLLIERAMLRLERQGKLRADQHRSGAESMRSMDGEYKPAPKQAPGIDRNQVSMLVSEGFKSKSLIKDVNSSISRYEETGILELEG